MSSLFWLDVGAWAFTGLVALTLALLALSADPRRRLNHLFAVFTFITSASATLATLLRLSLWLDRGNPDRLGELGAWAFAFVGPALLLFAAQYVGFPRRRIGVAAFAGVLWNVFILLPLLTRHRIIYDHRLDASGTTRMQFTTLGVAVTAVPMIYLVWSLILFWRHRRRGEGYMIVSTAALLLGVVVGGVLDSPFPLLSFAMGSSVIVLGYGVLRQQLFNPLRERNLSLQQEIAERRKAEAALQYRSRFEALVAEISTRFINLPSEAIDENIEDALGRVARFGGADAGYLFYFSEDGTITRLTHLWHNERLDLEPRVMQSFSTDTMSWGMNKLKDQQVLALSSDEGVPDATAAEWASIRAQGVRSMVDVPLVYQGQVFGFFGFASATGGWRWAEDEVSLLRVVGEVLTNALQRKLTEQALRASEAMLGPITNSMPSALITLNLEGWVIAWNPAATELTGVEERSALGRSLWDLSPDLARYQAVVEHVVAEGEPVRMSREVIHASGQPIYRDVEVFPLLADGIQGAVLRIEDVTGRVRLEEVTLQSAKMASVGGLAAGVAHEINNPLGAIMQGVQMIEIALDLQRPTTLARMQEMGVDPESLASYLASRGLFDYLDGVRQAGTRAAKIVNDLLGFSRRSESVFAPYDLNGLLRRTLDLAATDYDLKKRYDFRNMDLMWELDPDVPQVTCDGPQIQQVVLNLVRNAAQAMSSGAAAGETDDRPRLILRSGSDARRVRFEVEDNGPGIPEEVRSRLFEPFFTTKEVGEGTGLGLWLCWSIVVDRHGGRIWSEPGAESGTRFVVELPRE
jgi:PAS domain S-box-containing protein